MKAFASFAMQNVNRVQRVQQNAFHIWSDFFSDFDSSREKVTRPDALGGSRCQCDPRLWSGSGALLLATESQQKS
jgi:hypothetical protein